jgi:hypothetical protein
MATYKSKKIEDCWLVVKRKERKKTKGRLQMDALKHCNGNLITC